MPMSRSSSIRRRQRRPRAWRGRRESRAVCFIDASVSTWANIDRELVEELAGYRYLVEMCVDAHRWALRLKRERCATYHCRLRYNGEYMVYKASVTKSIDSIAPARLGLLPCFMAALEGKRRDVVAGDFTEANVVLHCWEMSSVIDTIQTRPGGYLRGRGSSTYSYLPKYLILGVHEGTYICS